MCTNQPPPQGGIEWSHRLLMSYGTSISVKACVYACACVCVCAYACAGYACCCQLCYKIYTAGISHWTETSACVLCVLLSCYVWPFFQFNDFLDFIISELPTFTPLSLFLSSSVNSNSIGIPPSNKECIIYCYIFISWCHKVVIFYDDAE